MAIYIRIPLWKYSLIVICIFINVLNVQSLEINENAKIEYLDKLSNLDKKGRTHDVQVSNKNAADDTNSDKNPEYVIINEAIPVKDSINYHDVLIYRFDPNLTEYWTHSYQLTAYLSGSLCKLPDNWDDQLSDNGLSIYYTFNETIATNRQFESMKSIPFENGFAGGLALMKISAEIENYALYIVVVPNECSDCDENSNWIFEFAVSQKNILFQYDQEPRISIVDVDYESAIVQTQEIIFGHNRSYRMYLFENEYPIPIGLNQSWCAISENQNFTQIVQLNETNLINNETMFVVSDLAVGRSYSAVLVITYLELPYGGGIFEPISFTMSKTKSCKLAYGLDFCNEVAYSIPISSRLLYGKESWNEFISAYDNYTESLYQPFEFAIQQIPCDTELDARYSPFRTCDDCRYSYKQWLCSVSIPRCVSSLNIGPFNKAYTSGDGRNQFISQEINPPLPYAEVLPCLNVCQAIVRDCPANFGFGCPETYELVQLSYGDPDLLNFTTPSYGPNNDLNIVADDNTQPSNSKHPGIVTSAMDGAVQTYRVCNYLGVSNLQSTTNR